MNFLIRADASSYIGSGHVMRCIALGQQLINGKNKVYFVTKTNNQSILNKLTGENFNVIKINNKSKLLDDALETISHAKDYHVDWVILDGYNFTTEYQSKIKKNNFRLFCIDDLAEKHFVSDFVLNQNLNAKKIFNYSCESYTKLLLGIEYVLLRREFLTERSWERKFNEDCKNILLTMGGSDPQNNTTKILSAINNIEKRLNINVVIGAENKFYEKIETLCDLSKHEIKLFRNVNNMVPLMKQADFAITSSGSTVWELAFLQTPMLTAIIADNQRFLAQELEKEKISKNLGWVLNADMLKIKNKIKSFIDKNEERKFIFYQVSKMKKNIASKTLLNIFHKGDYALQ